MAATGNARRQRRIRQRKRRGLVVLQIEVHEHRLLDALLQTRRLNEEASRRRSLVEREVGHLLDDWARRWAR